MYMCRLDLDLTSCMYPYTMQAKSSTRALSPIATVSLISNWGLNSRMTTSSVALCSRSEKLAQAHICLSRANPWNCNIPPLPTYDYEYEYFPHLPTNEQFHSRRRGSHRSMVCIIDYLSVLPVARARYTSIMIGSYGFGSTPVNLGTHHASRPKDLTD